MINTTRERWAVKLHATAITLVFSGVCAKSSLYVLEYRCHHTDGSNDIPTRVGNDIVALVALYSFASKDLRRSSKVCVGHTCARKVHIGVFTRVLGGTLRNINVEIVALAVLNFLNRQDSSIAAADKDIRGVKETTFRDTPPLKLMI